MRLLRVLQPAGVLIAVVALVFGAWTYWSEADDRATEREVRRATLIHFSWQRLLAAKGARRNQGQIEAMEFLVREDIALSQIDLSSTYLGGAKLAGAELRYAILRAAVLSDADLRGAILARAELQYTEFLKADLRGAVLNGANMRGANLTKADLRKAQLVDVDLAGADLRETDLREIIDLTQDQLNVACVNGKTRLPDGLERPPPCPEDEKGGLIR